MHIHHIMPSSLSLKNRLIIFFLMLISTILVGSLGYVVIKIYVEHQSPTLTDAIFFSVATISTLGHYPRGIELSSPVGEWFTILYLILGMGTIFGGIQALVSPWIELRIRNAIKEHRIPIPQDAHVVICGWNDVARLIQEKLRMLDIPYVIVAPDAPAELPAVAGDPGSSEALTHANINRAVALLALMDDKKNAVTILAARRLNGELRIISLCEREENKELLLRSGADVVVSRDAILNSIMQHWVNGDFTHLFTSEILGGLEVREFSVDKDTAGKSLKELKFRERFGNALALYRRGNILVNPPAEEKLVEGDVVIFLEGE